MARKVMQELSEMMRPINNQPEQIPTRLLEKTVYERRIRDKFNEHISWYLRTNHKGLGEIDKEDLERMTAKLNTKQKQVYMEQLMLAMRVNRGKPIKRIREHNKSVLLNQIDD